MRRPFASPKASVAWDTDGILREVSDNAMAGGALSCWYVLSLPNGKDKMSVVEKKPENLKPPSEPPARGYVFSFSFPCVGTLVNTEPVQLLLCAAGCVEVLQRNSLWLRAARRLLPPPRRCCWDECVVSLPFPCERNSTTAPGAPRAFPEPCACAAPAAAPARSTSQQRETPPSL